MEPNIASTTFAYIQNDSFIYGLGFIIFLLTALFIVYALTR